MDYYAKALGLVCDALTISAWKQGEQDSNVRPEINLYIHRNNVKLPLACLSEGERQRVDLACFFSLSSAAEQISGVSLGLRILDEPLTGMDADGREKCFHFITEAGRNLQIFIIDHNASFQNLFGGSLVVKKGENSYSTIGKIQ